jgi:hypothetical protein
MEEMKCFKDQLRKWQHDNGKKPKEKKQKQERLSERDIRELMGMNKAIYRRGPGGAFRQR